MKEEYTRNYQNNTIDLSISIVNTNNWKYLQPCLDSIIKNIHCLNYEILVVDNASEDGSAEKIKELFPNVILTINEKKYGFAKNNNINLKNSNGRYVMLLNDDTLVQPYSLKRAIHFLDNNKKVGVVGCEMINPNGTLQETCARRFLNIPNTFLFELGLSIKYIYHPLFDKTFIKPNKEFTEIDIPQESGMIIRKEVINEVGYLDEQFFMFGEGPDWCKRIKSKNWEIVLLSKTPIIHFGGTTNKKTNLKMYLQSYKSTYLLFKKTNYLISLFYRIMIIYIYVFKYIFIYFEKIFSKNAENDKFSKLIYYKELIKFMLFKVDDPNIPFPIN